MAWSCVIACPLAHAAAKSAASNCERTLASGFRQIATNWSDFDRSRTTSRVRQIEQSVDSPVRIERRGDRPSRIERREAISERGAVRLERQSARSERRSEARAARSEARAARESRSTGRGRDKNPEQ